MAGYQFKLRNIRLKKTPDKIHILSATPRRAGQNERTLFARAKKEAERWQAAEHYSPINSKEQKT